VEPATTDRIQRMIDAEAAERFPPGAVPQLMLLHYGYHPVIEPGELYLGSSSARTARGGTPGCKNTSTG
jgi:hypothetical protein